MTISIAPPPVRPTLRPAGKPRDPKGLDGLWPPGTLAPGDPELLRRPYQRGRNVPFAQSKCGTCVALCCRYISVEVDAPDVPKDFDTLRWFLLHENTQLFIEGRKWFVMFFTRCRALAQDNSCTIHPDRPSICREYTPDWCDRDEAEARTKMTHLFRTVEELDAWRERWVKRYEARRRREREASRLKRQRKLRRLRGATAAASRRGKARASR